MSLRYKGYLADITPDDHSEVTIANRQSIGCPINGLSYELLSDIFNFTMCESKQSLIERAMLLQQIEQYDDMASAMKKIVEMDPVLSKDEQDLFSVAFQKVIERRLIVWQILRSVEQKTEGSEQRQQMAKEYREKVENELKEICADVLRLLNQFLIPKAARLPSEFFYLHMKETYNGHFAEVAPGENRDGIEFAAWKVNYMSDDHLFAIFKHLPLYDRLRVSEVSRRWRDVSRKPWSDVKHLDLTPIPGPNIAAIVRQCSKLAHVYALRKKFGVNELRVLSRVSLSSVKLYKCEVAIASSEHIPTDLVSEVFSNHLRSAAWDELVLDLQLKCNAVTYSSWNEQIPASFPTSLKRLSFFAGNLENWNFFASHSGRFSITLCAFLTDVAELNQLECLMLHDVWHGASHDLNIGLLSNLRELFLSSMEQEGIGSVGKYLMRLTKLEVLFLYNAFAAFEGFGQLVTKHPALRILVLTGEFTDEIEFPTRLRYANGLSAAPLPQLHVFVGYWPSQRIRFPKFPSDAAKVYPISEPLPQFLDREDIKPIFDGVWIAAQIKETAANATGTAFANDVASSFLSIT